MDYYRYEESYLLLLYFSKTNDNLLSLILPQVFTVLYLNDNLVLQIVISIVSENKMFIFPYKSVENIRNGYVSNCIIFFDSFFFISPIQYIFIPIMGFLQCINFFQMTLQSIESNNTFSYLEFKYYHGDFGGNLESIIINI